MDGINRTAALAVFFIVVTAAIVGGWGLVSSQKESVNELEAQLAALRAERTTHPRINSPESPFKTSSGPGLSIEQRQRTQSLQRLLKQKDEILAKQNALLKKVSDEKDGLKSEIGQQLKLIIELAERERSDAENKTLQEEIERLRLELIEAEASDTTMSNEMASIREQLSLTQEELELLQSEAEARLAVVQAEVELLRSTAQAVFVDAGAAAVPALVRALSDRRASVRIWAAEALAAMGTVAIDAADALTAMSVDENPAVQGAARRALRVILP